ncbi:MAG: UPF0175 family protein [Candidatus Latescibacterota bacterium]
MTHHLSIGYGDDVLLAAKLHQLGKLTSGQAGRLCGKGPVDFLLALPRVGVSRVNLGAEDAEVEADILRRS